MLKSAKEIIKAGNTAEIVDFAIEVNRQIRELEAELEAAKAALREKGLQEATQSGENTASFPGTLGTATVVAVKPGFKVKKGVDLLACEAGINPGLFQSLFVKKTVVEFATDFEVKFAALPVAAKTVIGNLVEMSVSTPRVNLPK
jgi:hypothetical protein